MSKLKFRIQELSSAELKPYLIEFYNLYNIDRPLQWKAISGLKRFQRLNEAEYKDYQDIKPLINLLQNIGLPDSHEIKVGDTLSLLTAEIIFVFNEIVLSGVLGPSTVEQIKLHKDGSINYILFSDGDRYPRMQHATYQGRPVMYPMYFKNSDDAEQALTMIQLKKPNNWEFIDEHIEAPKENKMITEGTDNLYHVTNIQAALEMITTGKIKLTQAIGNKTELAMQHKDYRYYLSTTRSKIGDYTLTSTYQTGVVLNLDGRWIGQRYPVKPRDYWERMWLNNNDGRTSEMEDRVFSKTSEMPATPIQTIHLLHILDSGPKNERRNQVARQLLIAAKTRGIPIFLYNDMKAYLLQDTRKALDIKDAVNTLKGSKNFSGSARKNKYLNSWLELYYKKDFNVLTDYASKLGKKIIGNRYEDNRDFGLKNDMSNSMRPNAIGYESAVKIEKIMRKHKLPDVMAFVDSMIAKWEKIHEIHTADEYEQYKRKVLDKEPVTESIIIEARRDSLILVDFQPAYQTDDYGYDDAIDRAVHYINEKKPQVTAFYNGADVGIEDTKEEVMWHYLEHGLNEDLTHLFTFKEKSYAWLRSWMDEGVDDSTIIKVVRYMVMNDISDSRDIDEELLLEMVGDDGGDWMFDDGIYLPDISIGNLKNLSGSLLGGGGRSECLKELQLLMNSFNIRYKMVDAWIYG